MTDLDSFWQCVCLQLQRHFNTDNLSLAEQLVINANDCSFVVRAILGRAYDQTPVDEVFIADLQTILEWTMRAIPSNYPPTQFSRGICHTDIHGPHPGRPLYQISKEDLESLIEVGFTFVQIAHILGVSERTVRRRRELFGLPIGASHYSSISDTQLDTVVNEILQITMESGVSYVRGALLSRNIRVQRQRVIDSIRRVDPVSQSLRRLVHIHRRQYFVPGPNALWHIDGHHKLIRWKMVIHAGVDGYSRVITYLRCSNNNRASTVLELFLGGVERYGVPSRARSDHGGENIDVARFMISVRGTCRGSMITGSSTHNQRIERTWRDVHRVVVRQFSNLFYFLVSTSQLNPLNEVCFYTKDKQSFRRVFTTT